MYVHHYIYFLWVLILQSHNQLYQSNELQNNTELFAKFRKVNDTPVLSITPRAINRDLLGPSIVALLLLTEHHGQ